MINVLAIFLIFQMLIPKQQRKNVATHITFLTAKAPLDCGVYRLKYSADFCACKQKLAIWYTRLLQMYVIAFCLEPPDYDYFRR